MIPDYIIAALKPIIAEQIACCCAAGGGITIVDSVPTDPPAEGASNFQFNTSNDTFYIYYNDTWNPFTGGGGTSIIGTTTLSPPVDAPTGSDPVILFNLTTGAIYYYNGSAWLQANEGGTDTNLANTDLTLLADRAHDLNGFFLGFSGVGESVGYQWDADNGINAITQLKVTPGQSLFSHTFIGKTGQILLQNGEVQLESTDGIYRLLVTPVTDEAAANVLGYNPTTDRMVVMTKYTVSDAAFDSSWNGVTTVAPSKNAVYDEMILKANDADVVHDTGNETIAGVKTFSSDPLIPDEAYGPSWNGVLEPPTKNAVYDEMELKADLTDLTNLKLDQFGITIDGGGSVLSTGAKGYVRIPYSGTITGWTILEASGTPVTSSIVVDIWKDTYANYPPTVADTVFTDKPTISSGIKGQNNAPAIVSGKEVVTAGDIIGYNVDSVTSAIRVVVHIHITKT